MKAVILCQGTNSALLGLDEHQPGVMLPLGDRPYLQHVVEYAILAGARECVFIVSYLPEKIESYFGDGSRWGCRFSYQLAASPDHSWRMLRNLCSGWNEIVLLAQADIIPAAANLIPLSIQPTVVTSGEGANRTWAGWASFASATASRLFAGSDANAIAARLMAAGEQGEFSVLHAEECIDCRTPEGLIRSQRRLTAGELPNLMLNGNRAEVGVCIGHGVSIHPTASLRAPLYVGPNSRIGAHCVIGPGAVVSENCIVDAETSVVDSLITPGTYIGQGLELDSVIVDRNRLVNSRLATSCLISESFLVGSLTGRHAATSMFDLANRVIALLLYLITLPCLLFMFVRARLRLGLTVHQAEFTVLPIGLDQRTPGTGRRMIFYGAHSEVVGWKHFTREFVPGLISVVRGQLNLVGVPPRNASEIANMPEDWRSVYVSCRAGLVTEALIAYGAKPRLEEAYSADAFYRGMHSITYDCRLLFRYLGHILIKSTRRSYVPVDLDCEAE